MKKYGILFVCTGNICRSPIAEGVFRHYVEKSGLSDRFLIDSAGTHGYHIGEAPDSRGVAAAMARGIDMSDLRARKVTARDFNDFDLILAMDTGHYDIMRPMALPDCRARLSMFMDFAPGAGIIDVPDPYYGGEAEFEYVLDLAEQGVTGLLKHLKTDL